MKKLTLLLGFVLLPIFATATEIAVSPPKFALPTNWYQDPEPPSGWAGAYLFQVTGGGDDRMSAGVLRNLKSWQYPTYRITLDAYAGMTIKTATPIAAALLGFQKEVLKDFTLGAHAGFAIRGGHPSGVVIGVSANVRF